MRERGGGRKRERRDRDRDREREGKDRICIPPIEAEITILISNSQLYIVCKI